MKYCVDDAFNQIACMSEVPKSFLQFHFLQFNLLIYMRGTRPALPRLVDLQAVAKNGKEVLR